jgi:hypothetical protein
MTLQTRMQNQSGVAFALSISTTLHNSQPFLYVWGQAPPDPRSSSICGEDEVKVTANNLSAMRHLRQKLGSVTIWIDAVCI